jgi:hypothetical protein
VQVLIERFGAHKHAHHGRHAVNIPRLKGLIESACTSKHALHVRNARRVPRRHTWRVKKVVVFEKGHQRCCSVGQCRWNGNGSLWKQFRVLGGCKPESTVQRPDSSVAPRANGRYPNHGGIQRRVTLNSKKGLQIVARRIDRSVRNPHSIHGARLRHNVRFRR